MDKAGAPTPASSPIGNFQNHHIMKRIILIEPISKFEYKSTFKVRTEIEHYSGETKATVVAQYEFKNSVGKL